MRKHCIRLTNIVFLEIYLFLILPGTGIGAILVLDPFAVT